MILSNKLLILILLFSSFFIIDFSLDFVYADEEEIIPRFFSFENTSILEFTNNSDKNIQTIRIWLDDSFFKSFKFEDDWTVSKTSNGIIFDTSESIKPNETIKIGVKTEKSYPLINWELIDSLGNTIKIGQTQSQNISSLIKKQVEKSINETAKVFSESTFKIIPQTPHPGSAIRVVGDNFTPNSKVDLFLNNIKLKSFETDEYGYFILTLIIPKKIASGPTDFILKDSYGNEKVLSVTLMNIEENFFTNKEDNSKSTRLTVSDIENKFYRTDVIEFSGTTIVGDTITIETINSRGELFSKKTINVNYDGIWSDSLNIAFDAPIDEYITTITDGKDTITKSWDVVLSKNVNVSPSKLKFQSGELIKFTGTANPGEQLDVKFIDPQGNYVLSKNFIVGDSGFFNIEYLTTTSSLEGTYVLYLFQNSDVEITFVGLNEYPKKYLSAKLNRVNYNVDDVPIIGILGNNIQELKLEILDQNDHVKFNDFIELGSDGKRNYALETKNFSPGIYTFLASMAGSQISEVFTIGLESHFSSVDFKMTQHIFHPGQPMFLSGNSASYSTVDLFLIDPDGIIVGEQESFTNQNGVLSVNDFIIPYDAIFGNWIVRSESGTRSTNFEFQVTPLSKVTQSIHVSDILSSSIGAFVTIEGFVSEEQTVTITIEDPNGSIIFVTNVDTTDIGNFDLLWKSQASPIPGTYLVTVKDSLKQTTSTSFDL